jgi:hypothetical protein
MDKTQTQTLYEILGVVRDATRAQIKKAYYREVLTCHPDKFPGDDTKTAQFLRLKDAYEELSDEEKRDEYDRTGETETEREIPNQNRNKVAPQIRHPVTAAQLLQGGKVDVEIRGVTVSVEIPPRARIDDKIRVNKQVGLPLGAYVQLIASDASKLIPGQFLKDEKYYYVILKPAENKNDDVIYLLWPVKPLRRRTLQTTATSPVKNGPIVEDNLLPLSDEDIFQLEDALRSYDMTVDPSPPSHAARELLNMTIATAPNDFLVYANKLWNEATGNQPRSEKDRMAKRIEELEAQLAASGAVDSGAVDSGGATGLQGSEDRQQEIIRLSQQVLNQNTIIEQKDSEIKRLQQSMKELESSSGSGDQELESLREEVGVLSSELESVRGQLTAKTAELSNANSELEMVRSELGAAESRVENIRTQFTSGQGKPPATLSGGSRKRRSKRSKKRKSKKRSKTRRRRR